MAAENVRCWSCGDVGLWLKRNGFDDYVETLSEQHKINGAALLILNENDLRSPPLQIQTLGDIKRLWLAISELQRTRGARNSCAQRRSLDRVDGPRSDAEILSGEDSDDEDSGIAGQLSRFSDFGRTLVSVAYAAMVFFLTSFVMALVHDRVPDMKKYPPLPDIVLDNVPLIPWAFTMCEISAMILSVILAVVVFLHKHRLILLRRMFALAGTVFLLRCLTMFVTSLSVPGIHLECSGKLYGDTSTRLQRAGEIFFGGGLSLNGVRSCGDYMFSGHTVSITLLNFFITEYTPSSMYYLHTSCWVLNLFGIFFILAAHEHYSIDVVIAFYISSRLFLYYHTLANARALRRGDRKRFRVWFPLFWFFEKKMEGKVPNEYEWPLPWPKWLHYKEKKG